MSARVRKAIACAISDNPRSLGLEMYGNPLCSRFRHVRGELSRFVQAHPSLAEHYLLYRITTRAAFAVS